MNPDSNHKRFLSRLGGWLTYAGMLLLIVNLVLALFSVPASAIRVMDHVTPTPWSGTGTPKCEDFGSFIEFKIEGADLDSTAAQTDGTLIVTLSGHVYNDDTPPELIQFDWDSNIGVDLVIVKGGRGANLYWYVPEATSDDDLVASATSAISHISFCYDLVEPTPTPTTPPEPTATPTTPPEEPTATPTTPPEEPTATPTTPPEEPTATPTTPPEEPTATPTTPPSGPTPTPPPPTGPTPTSEILGIVLPTTGFGPPPVDAGSLGLGLRLMASALMTLSGLALRRLSR